VKKAALPLVGLIVGTSGVAGHSAVRAGAAKVDITPDSRVFIAGYGQNRICTGVHDPIWARCIVLEIAGSRIAFLSLDLIGLFWDDVEVIRKGAASPSLPAENIIISCTHNHEGPDTLGLWGPEIGRSGVDSRYKLLVREKAVECVKEAESKIVPAQLRVGQTRVEGVSRNARDKDILDPVLVALKAEDDQGRCIATLVNFANHPEALGSRNTLISADWPHYLYATVEEALGGICILQNGALGGMVTPDVSSHTFEEAERIGATTGLRAVECLQGSPVMPCENLTHLSATLDIPVANKNFLALRKAGVITRTFHHGKVRTELHVIRFGDVEMATIPGEALPKVGLAIKSYMTARYKILIGLGNDELGYIIPEEDFDPTKYEESMSVGPKIAPAIEAKLKALLTGHGTGSPRAGPLTLALLLMLFGGGACGVIWGLRRRRDSAV